MTITATLLSALCLSACGLTACDRAPSKSAGEAVDVAQLEFSQSQPEAGEAEQDVATAYRTPVISDEGKEIGEIRSYSLDRNGRIVAAQPRDRRLEPSDAPREEPVI